LVFVLLCIYSGLHAQHLKRSLKRFYNNHSSHFGGKIKSCNDEIKILPLSNPSKTDQPQLKIHDTTSVHHEDINTVRSRLLIPIGALVFWMSSSV
jgi:hypothetical protein